MTDTQDCWIVKFKNGATRSVREDLNAFDAMFAAARGGYPTRTVGSVVTVFKYEPLFQRHRHRASEDLHAQRSRIVKINGKFHMLDRMPTLDPVL